MHENEFLDRIVSEPTEYRNYWLVLADWLEDVGDRRADLIRVTEQLTREIEIDDRDQMEQEMRYLLYDLKISPVLPHRTNSIDMEFVLVPDGTFRMGSPLNERRREEHEGPVEVTISKPFWVGRYPITVGQWAQIGVSDPVSKNADHPMTLITWEQVTEFCLELSEREFPDGDMEYGLLTEAQWEFACRAGTTTANVYGNRQNRHLASTAARAVGRRPGNAFGLYDFHGSVWEWVQNCYEPLENGTDPPKFPAVGHFHVLRGGNRSACRTKGQFEPSSVFGEPRGSRIALFANTDENTEMEQSFFDRQPILRDDDDFSFQ